MSSTRKTLIALTAAVAMAVGGGQVLVSTVCACSAPPESQFAPVVTGATTIGQTLSTSNGTWVASGNLASHPNTSYTYQWQRCNSSGASCVDIAAATASTHTVVAGDVGYTLRAVVTATNNGGSTDANSNVTDPITGNLASLLFGKQTVGGTLNGGLSADAKRVIRVTPTSSGDVVKLSEYFAPTGTVGTQSIRGVLYANTTSACPVGETDCPGTRLGISDPITFANTNSAGWYDLVFPDSPPVTADGTYWLGNISGSTAAIAQYAYDTAGSNVRDLNANIYTDGPANPFGAVTTTDTQEFSAYGTIGDSGSPINSVVPTVSDQTSAGRWQVGDNAAFAAGTWSPTGSITQRWQRCTGILCANIPGATASTYTLTAADVDSTIRAVVTESNATGATSAASAVSSVIVAGGTPSLATWIGDSLSSTVFTRQSSCSGNVTVVPDPLGSGHDTIRMSIPSSCSNGNAHPRADFASPRYFAPNTTWYLSDSFMFPDVTQIPNPTNGGGSQYVLFDEAYNFGSSGCSCSSPHSPSTQVMTVSGTNRLVSQFGAYSNGASVNNWNASSAVQSNTWYTMTYHVRWSTTSEGSGSACNGSACNSTTCNAANMAANSGSTGFVQLWYDGVAQTIQGNGTSYGSVLGDGGKTLCYQTLDASNYGALSCTSYPGDLNCHDDDWIIDSYRAVSGSGWSIPLLTLYHGFAKIGTTFASVQPDVAPNGP